MRTLTPPDKIEAELFVLVWDPDQDFYVLFLKDGRSYTLGNAQDTLIYFRYVLNLEKIGQRAMDCSRNFYTAIALIKEARVFSAETVEAKSEYHHLFQTEPDSLLVV